MKVINAIKSGISFIIRRKGITIFIYFTILALGLAFALPIFSSIKNTAGHRLEIQNLLMAYDFTAHQDFMREFGDITRPVLAQIKWMVFIYLILNIFFTGGILQICKTDNHSIKGLKEFFIGGQQHFTRIAVTVLLFFVIHIGVTLLVWIPIGISFSGGLNKFSSEIVYINRILIGLIINILLVTMVSMVSDYVKTGLVRDPGSGYFRIFGQQIGVAIRNFRNTYLLYMVQFLLFILLVFLYLIFEAWIGNTSPLRIFLLFIIQQILIFKRIGLRVLGYSATWHMNRMISPVLLLQETPEKSMSILGSSQMIKS